MKKILSTTGAAFLLLVSSHGAEAGGIVGKVKGRWIEKHQALVFVQNVSGGEAKPPSVHPVMNQKDKTLIPHILPVMVGATVEFRNSDLFKHNIFSPDGERYNLGSWVQGKEKSYTFKKPGVYRQLCNVHPEMLAYIVVLETPYFALTDKAGNFQIAGVPAGRRVLKVWAEKLTMEQVGRTFEVTVEERKPAFIEIDLLR